MRIQKSFWTGIAVKGWNDCWLWLRGKTRTGYGVLKRNTHTVLAHRYMYSICNGVLIEGLYVCHKCDNPLCVNPVHLEQTTPAKNNTDCYARNRRTPPRKFKTHHNCGHRIKRTKNGKALRCIPCYDKSRKRYN